MNNPLKKQNPKVSVVMPNLNYRHYMDERIQSVLNQTFTDFEYIIVDSYSDDGAWELIQEYAEKDSRMRISQAPRGIYWTCWNICIQQARGEYIYIATSDDTMMPDCLEKMVSALDSHPECGICHCCLKAIDEKGEEIPGWWYEMPAPQFYGELMNKPHIRLAPYDGILHCAFGSIYLSMTQLLIRRKVFEQVGLFRTNWGPEGDFEWCMRASLVQNTLHIPETLATWRIHSKQKTNRNYETPTYWAKYCEMVKAAIPILKIYNPECYNKINKYRLLFPYTRQCLKYGMKESHRYTNKMLFLLSFIFTSPTCVVDFIFTRFLGRRLVPDNFTYLRQELKNLNTEHNVKILE